MGKKVPYFLGLLMTIFTLWAFLTTNVVVRTFVDRLNNIAYDLQFRAHIYTSPKPKLAPIAILDIDDKSLKAEGQWPWPRDKLASLVELLQKQHVTAIVFDVLFAEKETNLAAKLLDKLNQLPNLATSCVVGLKENINLFDGDKIFSKSLLNNNVILANTYILKDYTQNSLPSPMIELSKDLQSELAIYTIPGFIGPIPELQQAAKGEGFVTVEHDNDGIVRRASLIVQYKGGVYPALSLQTVKAIFDDPVSLVTHTYNNISTLEGIQLGTLFIPTNAQGKVLIPFVGRAQTFPTFSVTDVLNNRLPPNTLMGKIVIIGTSALGLGDIHPTVVSATFPGTEIQATLINAILQKNFFYIPFWTFGANFSFIIIFGLIGTFVFPAFGPRLLAISIIVIPLTLLFLNDMIWRYFGFIFASILPVLLIIGIALLNLIYGYLFETKKREYLRSVFGQYVPEKHIDEMMKTGDALSLHGEEREMTVLFADIRNFTTISEKVGPTVLVKMLNDFFTGMTEIIFKYHGTIDKYVGDQLDAFWGAPLKDKHHARHAMECALEMNKKVQAMKSYWEAQQLPEIRIGLGVSTGRLLVGDMGSRYRRNYTVQGDAANLGSRLEGLTKVYGVNIIVAEATQRNQPKFVFRRLGKVRVKGKEIALEIFELVCLKSELTEELKTELAEFHLALDYYFQQKWNEAYRALSSLNERYPNHKLYTLYMERVIEYKQHPPPVDWDGTFVHTSK